MSAQHLLNLAIAAAEAKPIGAVYELGGVGAICIAGEHIWGIERLEWADRFHWSSCTRCGRRRIVDEAPNGALREITEAAWSWLQEAPRG